MTTSLSPGDSPVSCIQLPGWCFQLIYPLDLRVWLPGVVKVVMRCGLYVHE